MVNLRLNVEERDLYQGIAALNSLFSGIRRVEPSLQPLVNYFMWVPWLPFTVLT